jgi:hypothetical protein
MAAHHPVGTPLAINADHPRRGAHARACQCLLTLKHLCHRHRVNQFTYAARQCVTLQSAAETLQTSAVSLVKGNSLHDALTATDAAIELRRLAIARGAGVGVVLENVKTMLLKAEIHRRRMEEAQALHAIEEARALFGDIDPASVAAQEWRDRYREVEEMIKALAGQER